LTCLYYSPDDDANVTQIIGAVVIAQIGQRSERTCIGIRRSATEPISTNVVQSKSFQNSNLEKIFTLRMSWLVERILVYCSGSVPCAESGGKVMMIELLALPLTTHFSSTHSPVCFWCPLLLIPPSCFYFVTAPVCVCIVITATGSIRHGKTNAHEQHKCTETIFHDIFIGFQAMAFHLASLR
jgi:hypothetical protein